MRAGAVLALAIGVMVEGYAMGRSAQELASEMLRVLGVQAIANLRPGSVLSRDVIRRADQS